MNVRIRPTPRPAPNSASTRSPDRCPLEPLPGAAAARPRAIGPPPVGPNAGPTGAGRSWIPGGGSVASPGQISTSRERGPSRGSRRCPLALTYGLSGRDRRFCGPGGPCPKGRARRPPRVPRSRGTLQIGPPSPWQSRPILAADRQRELRAAGPERSCSTTRSDIAGCSPIPRRPNLGVPDSR